jgi:DNA-directed RNA polymerase specialized sigma24 family protein
VPQYAPRTGKGLEGRVTVEDAAEDVAASAAIATSVERAYPLMVLIASVRGARPADVRGVLVAAVRAAAADPADAERILLRTVIRGAAPLERAAPRAEDWDVDDEPAVPAKELEVPGSRWEDWFKRQPQSFAVIERGRASAAARETAAAAISRLPLAQRVVIVLRDVGGWTGDEISELLPQLPPDLQRALLHAGRARVRRALERFVATKATKRV